MSTMLFSSRKNDELLLILDVESSIVRSTLILDKVGKNPHILFTCNTMIPHEDSGDSQRLITTTVKATKQVVDETVRQLALFRQGDGQNGLPHKISSVHYVLSSPWILSEAKRLEITFDKQRTVTQELIAKMIQDERENLSTEVKAKNKTVRVEEKIFDVELNGYSISNWRGKMANTLSVSFVTSISGTKMVDRFKELCSSTVSGHDVHFHSSLLVQHIGTVRVFPDKDAYAIVHIHGEITDIAEVERRSCVFFGTYPIGTNTILRSLSRDSGMGLSTAASSMALHVAGALDDMSGKDSEMVKKAYGPWVEQLDRSLKLGRLPYDGRLSVVVAAYERQDAFISLLHDRYPKMQVHVLVPEEVLPYVTYEPEAERSVMTCMYVIGICSLRPD